MVAVFYQRPYVNYMCGTQDMVPEEIATSQHEVLFGLNPWFDGPRWKFLVGADSRSPLPYFRQKLITLYYHAVENTDATEVP